MNQLKLKSRTFVLKSLVEGNSLRSTARLAGVAINTVKKLSVDAGAACAKYQDAKLRGLPCERIQYDKIWAFCYARQENVPEDKQGRFGYGDVWTWMAIDADTKLVPSWYQGGESVGDEHRFVEDITGRLSKGVLFAGNYCIERQKLTMRMSMRRFTRLTNAFSKKIENHMCAIALYFMHYNFARPHQALSKSRPTTPAMAAGVSDHIWTMREILGLIPLLSFKRGMYAKRARLLLITTLHLIATAIALPEATKSALKEHVAEPQTETQRRPKALKQIMLCPKCGSNWIEKDYYGDFSCVTCGKVF